ncbi:nickel-dependent hydrogenase b-type cytochrome subunit, partial [Neisseria gonorrhoeae]
MKNKTKVWDFPTRLFHWLLAASLPFMWYSAKAGGDMLQWHTRVGLLVLF